MWSWVVKVLGYLFTAGAATATTAAGSKYGADVGAAVGTIVGGVGGLVLHGARSYLERNRGPAPPPGGPTR